MAVRSTRRPDQWGAEGKESNFTEDKANTKFVNWVEMYLCYPLCLHDFRRDIYTSTNTLTKFGKLSDVKDCLTTHPRQSEMVQVPRLLYSPSASSTPTVQRL